MDAEILIQLNEGHHPSVDYMRKMRAELPRAFPGSTFYFQTADIVSQVLNFGLSAPIDVQIQGARHQQILSTWASKLLARWQKIPGVADPHILQVMSYPDLKVDVDRQRAAEVGVNQSDVANNMLTALSSSAGVAPILLPQPASMA